MTMDERLAEMSASIVKPETETEVNTQSATDDTNVEEVSNTGDNGETGGEQNPTEGKNDSKDSLPKDEVKPTGANAGTNVEPRKFTKKEKARHAFAELTSKNSTLKNKLKQVLDYVEQAKGIKYDPNTMSLEDYLALREETSRLDTIRQSYEAELNSSPSDLRVAQAEAIWEDNEEAVSNYRNNVLPHVAEINKVLQDKAPIVARFLRSCENAPLLESAFISEEGMEWLNFVNTNDSQATWDRCKKMERELLDKAYSSPKSTNTAKPSVANNNVATPKVTSTRATTSATTASAQKGGAPIQAPSVDAIRKLLRG